MNAANPLSSPDDTVEMQYPLMPNLASPYFYFHHTLHSGLEALSRLGISGPRITIKMRGAGWRPDWIVSQEPAAGIPLRPDVMIQLSVAGLGFFHQLPSGMWESTPDGEIGTKEIVELFDDPLQKARHWVREGARVFDLHPDSLTACSKWISLFGLDPNDWPPAMWYQLALLAPELHRLAGRAEGVCKVLSQLLGLNVLEIRTHPDWLQLDQKDLSFLGKRSSELGIDLILGNRLPNTNLWEIRVGPMTLEFYQAIQSQENQRLLNQAMELCVPLCQKCNFTWIVLDPDNAPRLGIIEENACLGVNSWMGPEPENGADAYDRIASMGTRTEGYPNVI
jgi:Type VI secretion, TssG